MWLARNKEGNLLLYQSRPEYRDYDDWWTFKKGETVPMLVDETVDAFPEVKFENSPQEVTISLKNKEQL